MTPGQILFEEYNKYFYQKRDSRFDPQEPNWTKLPAVLKAHYEQVAKKVREAK